MKRFWMIFLLALLALPVMVFAQDQKVVWDLSKDNYIDVKDLGFRFYYPKGWVFDTSNGITIAENQADLDAQIDNDDSTQPKGEIITVMGVDRSTLSDLPADAKLDDVADYVVKQAKIKESDRVEVPIMTRRSISVFGKSSDGRYGIGSIWMQDGYLVLATVGAGDAKTINQLSYTWGTVLGSIEPLNALELGEETIALPDAGLTIQYPKGWTIDPKNPLLVYESEKDAANGSALPEKNAVGLLDQSLKDYGLKDDATIDDVVRVNKGAMGLKESSITSSEFIILDQPAITLKAANGATSDDTHWGFLTQFIYNGRAVTLVAIAPTEKALDEFEPTWLAMLRSIKATEKSAK